MGNFRMRGAVTLFFLGSSAASLSDGLGQRPNAETYQQLCRAALQIAAGYPLATQILTSVQKDFTGTLSQYLDSLKEVEQQIYEAQIEIRRWEHLQEGTAQDGINKLAALGSNPSLGPGLRMTVREVTSLLPTAQSEARAARARLSNLERQKLKITHSIALIERAERPIANYALLGKTLPIGNTEPFRLKAVLDLDIQSLAMVFETNPRLQKITLWPTRREIGSTPHLAMIYKLAENRLRIFAPLHYDPMIRPRPNSDRRFNDGPYQDVDVDTLGPVRLLSFTSLLFEGESLIPPTHGCRDATDQQMESWFPQGESPTLVRVEMTEIP